MERYLDFVLKRPVVVIIGIAVITIVLGSGIPKVRFESSLDAVMPKEDREYILNNEVKRQYGNNGNFIILCVSSDDALEPRFLSRVELLHQDLEEFRNFNESREERRIGKLKSLVKQRTVSREELLGAFRDDGVYRRFLRRTAVRLFGDRSTFDGSDIRRIQSEAVRVRKIRKQRYIDIIVSPYTVQDLVGKKDALITYDLIERDDEGRRIVPATPDEIAAFHRRLTNNPAFNTGIYAKDPSTGRITDFGVMVRLKDLANYGPIVEEVRAVTAGYGDLDITLQGIPVIYREINQYMKNDLMKFYPLVLLVVVFVFFRNFRTVRGVVLPFLTLNLAVIWVLGLMGHLGYTITVVGIALPPLMIAVGSSYSIHILNQYYIDLDDITRMGKREGLMASMSHISMTVLLAGITTFIGFIMMITNQVSSIREWGVFSAIGVLFAVFISISLVPAVFVLIPHRELSMLRNKKSGDAGGGAAMMVDRVVQAFGVLATKHHRAVVGVTAVVLVLSCIGMSKVIVETSIHAYFKEGDPVLVSSKKIGEKFGGAFGLNIIIDTGEKNGVKDPKFLKVVECFREWLTAPENIDLNVGRTDAFGDFIKTMNLAMHNNDPAYYRIPDRKLDVASYIDVFTGEDENDDGRIDAFESYVDFSYRHANILARIWEKQGELISSRHMDHLITRVNRYLDRNLPPGYTYRTSGEPKIIVRLAEHVVTGQIMSLLFSLAAVGMIVFLLFRNWKAGLISLIPITVAVIVNFGVMGWFGIRLDLATAIIASITIGIGIDDTIHFMNTYRHFRSQELGVDDTIRRTLQVSGKAIIFTSLALIFGFLVLGVSSFKPIILFGILVAVTMVATTLGALLVLPAVIRATGVALVQGESESVFWKYFDIGRFFFREEREQE
ncbi:MAG TPA: efflux RND transporter permease subunit [Spirochaetota bacterium]|nr:efflux RND transporter permease subunit [Spirochaetota bacterium]